MHVADVLRTGFPNSGDARGILAATVTVSGKCLRLVTTHLESGANTHQARCEQCADVLREDAHIVAGDFNLRDSDVVHAQNWRDAWVLSGRDADHRYTWDTIRNTRLQAQQRFFVTKTRFRFDRIYVRNDDTVQVSRFSLITNKVRGTHPSDHFARLASVSLR